MKIMLENLILYFVYKTKGFITKTQLVKFLYLADLYSVKWTGNQLTELDWYYYNYGPWNEEIDSALQRLEEKISQKQNGDFIMIDLNGELPEIDDFNFSEGLRLMLDNIRKEWAGGKVKDLLAHVYETAPMLAVKQNNHIPEDKAPLNLQLERIKLIEELGV
jgi:Protein of unknown function (DUF4065)